MMIVAAVIATITLIALTIATTVVIIISANIAHLVNS